MKTFLWGMVALVGVVAVFALEFGLDPFGLNSHPNPRVERRDLRVLVAIDTSGSMAKPIPDESVRRIDAAIAGTKAGLAKLTLPYKLGVWVFAQPGHTEVAPIDPASIGRVKTIGRQLETIARKQRSDGGTPLYTTIAAGVGALRLAALADTKKTVSALVDPHRRARRPTPRDGPRGHRQVGGPAQPHPRPRQERAGARDGRLQALPTLFGAVRSLPADNCLTVNTSDDIERRLGEVLSELENARKQ